VNLYRAIANDVHQTIAAGAKCNEYSWAAPLSGAARRKPPVNGG